MATTTTWTLADPSSGKRVFYRPLGDVETSYYWDILYDGTADIAMNIELCDLQGTPPTTIPRVVRTWASIKRRFPLLVAETQNLGNGVRFVVREERIGTLVPEEVTYRDIGSRENANAFASAVLVGPPPLSTDLLARMYVLRRTDNSHRFHVIILIAHCIIDSCSTSTIMRTFCDTLASSIEHPVAPLEDRLAMCLPLESRVRYGPYGRLNDAQWRWKRAIGFVLYALRSRSLQGGHTLPAKLTTTTFVTPALSGILAAYLSPEISKVIMTNCRRHGITFNNAYFVLSQVAMTRVLCRRYLRGEIGEKEWEYRKRQPMHILGPLDLRSYLDQKWYQSGGAGEVGLNVGYFHCILPFMPLGSSRELRHLGSVDGAPPFPSLLSFKRFVYRAKLLKIQTEKFCRHPRFLDIVLASHSLGAKKTREVALEWINRNRIQSRESLPIEWVDDGRWIPTQIGASVGNVDPFVPLEYPLPSKHPLSPISVDKTPSRAGYSVHMPPMSPDHDMHAPAIRIAYWRTFLHARSGELYIGALTSRQMLQYHIFYDRNVFSDDVVAEWLDEIQAATIWYLGRGEERVHSKL
ncbi:hypothetical protein V8B97DRAFT_465440 [Scleroderma yunnanense]